MHGHGWPGRAAARVREGWWWIYHHRIQWVRPRWWWRRTKEERGGSRTVPAEAGEATVVAGDSEGEEREVDPAVGGSERGEGSMGGSPGDFGTFERVEDAVSEAEGVAGVSGGNRVVEFCGLDVVVSPSVASRVEVEAPRPEEVVLEDVREEEERATAPGVSMADRGKGVADGESSDSPAFPTGPVGITPQDFAESAAQEDVLAAERETPGVLNAVREAVLESREAELAQVGALAQEEEARAQEEERRRRLTVVEEATAALRVRAPFDPETYDPPTHLFLPSSYEGHVLVWREYVLGN